MENLINVFDKGVNTRKMLIATLTATIGGFLFGYDIVVVGPALIYLTPFFHLTTIETSFVGSGIFLTAFFAAIINGKFADKYGRKKLLILDGVIFFIFAIFTALSVNAIPEVKDKSMEEMSYVFKDGFWKSKKNSNEAYEAHR